MKVTFLGTGTSVGIPSVGCDCGTCLSTDPRDNRLRASVLVEQNSQSILIDASTDFRQQALRHSITALDAVLFTHAHADHCFGLDDTRPLMFRHGPLACFASQITWDGLRRVYSYAFQPAAHSAVPRIVPHLIEGDFSLLGLEVMPLIVMHGNLPVTAYRLGSFGYVTDCNLIPDEAVDRLAGVELLVIDALRFKPHPTHLALADSLRYIERIRPRRALLTHIAHDIKHQVTSETLPDGVGIAYDGLQVETAG